MSPRFTARISVDLLIPSHCAAALVESAGFICFQPEQTRQPAQTCAGSEGVALGGDAAEFFGVLGTRRGGSNVDHAGADQLTEAAFHGIHAILDTRLEHVAELPGLPFLDQVLDGEGVEQDDTWDVAELGAKLTPLVADVVASGRPVARSEPQS